MYFDSAGGCADVCGGATSIVLVMICSVVFKIVVVTGDVSITVLMIAEQSVLLVIAALSGQDWCDVLRSNVPVALGCCTSEQICILPMPSSLRVTQHLYRVSGSNPLMVDVCSLSLAVCEFCRQPLSETVLCPELLHVMVKESELALDWMIQDTLAADGEREVTLMFLIVLSSRPVKIKIKKSL